MNRLNIKPRELRLLMKTGKHAGLTVTLVDMPAVAQPKGNGAWLVLLPGLEGIGVEVPDDVAAN